MTQPLVATADSAQRRAERTPLEEIRLLLAVAAIGMVMFPRLLNIFSVSQPIPPSTSALDFVTAVFPVDILLGLLVVASVLALAQRLRCRRLGAGATGWLAVSMVLLISWLVHPAPRGVPFLIDQFGTVALAATLAEIDLHHHRTLVAVSAAVVGVTECLWALAQRFNGGNLGLQRLGEADRPLFPIRSATAPDGSLVHPYMLAGLSLVVCGVIAVALVRDRHPWRWAAAALVVAAPIGFTYSRDALLAVVLLLAVLAIGSLRDPQHDRRVRYLLAATAIGIGAAVPAAFWSQGWVRDASTTASATRAGNVAELSTGRTTLMSESVALIRHHPITGVGPGQYVIALRDYYRDVVPKSVGQFRAVHDVPLLVAAEGGILAGVALVALLAVIGVRALRSGYAATALFVAFVPFFIFDKFPYSAFDGAVMTGLWLGVLDACWARRRRVDQSSRGDSPDLVELPLQVADLVP